MYVPYDDYLFLRASTQKTVEGIRRFSPHDAEAYPKFLAFFERAPELLNQIYRKGYEEFIIEGFQDDLELKRRCMGLKFLGHEIHLRLVVQPISHLPWFPLQGQAPLC
jgi:hypothetical protein